MRRAFDLLSLLLALSLLPLAVAPVSAGGKPVALPLEPIKNFDIVAKGEVLEHSFEIRNDGAAALEISDVRPACGCTVAKFDRVVAPGAIGKVYAELDTSDFAGPISKSIAVFTNDPENPKLQLVMKARVQPFIGVSPGFARYVYVRGEPVRPISQILWAEDGKPIRVTGVETPYDFVKASYREAKHDERNEKAEGPQWIVEIHIQPDAPVGALREFVEIQVAHPKQKEARIPLSGFVRPRQHVTPMEVELGSLQGNALPLRRTFHFTNFATDPIQVEKIETGYDAISVQVQPSERQPGHRFKLAMTVDSGMPKGVFDTVMRIHTTDPQNPVVEVPIKGAVE